MAKYTLREQRKTYLTTISNDVILKEFQPHERYLDQWGTGKRIFKGLWSYGAFRLLVNILLPFVMLMVDITLPVYYLFSLCFHKKKKYPLKRLYLHHERRLYNLSKTIGLQKDDDVWFNNVFDLMRLPDTFKSLNVFDLVGFRDVFACSFQAVILHINTIVKYGYNKYLLSERAFDWCLIDCALRKIPLDTELIYSSLCNRMAIMYDKLPHKNKTIIQHGTMHFFSMKSNNPHIVYQKDLGFYTWESLYKSSPSRVYCYTKDDELALSRSVFANKPEFIHIGYGFKPSFKPEKKSVLIVGNYTLFEERERLLLSKLQDLDIDVFLKNHPAIDNKVYDKIRKKYKFIFIEGMDTRLPDVDVLISYNSTLAFEYSSIGTPVLYYGFFDIENIQQIIMDKLNRKK